MKQVTKRVLSVSGQFYPNSSDEIKKYINHFDNILKENNISINQELNIKAIIVPHAGYIYSGFTANIGYKYIPKSCKKIVVIGPSHKYNFKGASVAMYDVYPTPIGELIIDDKFSLALLDKYDFLTFNDKVHSEHSTEVQFPFIKYYKSDCKVVEIVYSDISSLNLQMLIDEILEDNNSLLVISTDLSHFHSIDVANKLDNICLEAIKNIDYKLLDNGCEACGKKGVDALLQVAKERELSSKILDYRTSGDVSDNKNRVVGYVSAIFYK